MNGTATTLAGRYRLCAELGRGGLGVVWEACDDLLQRDVAVKELRFPDGLSEEERERLAERTLRDAQAVAAIDTAAAVRVFDVVEQDGRPWVVMEMLRGRSLTDVIVERENLPSAEAARIGLVVLEALEVAHRAGLVHRDVKPSNVIISDDGRIALGDFGIATVDSDPDDGTGVIVGSPLYLAPEQVAGEEPTPESDIWALGATLWTAVEGAPPTEPDSPGCERCTPELAELLAAMMARDPERRPRHDHIRNVLEAVCRDARAAAVRPRPASAALPPSFDRSHVIDASEGGRRSGRTWPWVAAIVVVLGAAALLLGQLLGGGSEPAPAQAEHKPSAPARPTLPDGWHRYTDPSAGWSVGVPDTWVPIASSGGVRIDDPASGRYVQVMPGYSTSGTALDLLQTQEASFAGSHLDYAQIGMSGADVSGADDAAEWEFTYSDQGAALHTLDRAVVIDGQAYTVWFQSHADDWDAAADVRETVLASFRAA
jgi:serine/threonine protein kinase